MRHSRKSRRATRAAMVAAVLLLALAPVASGQSATASGSGSQAVIQTGEPSEAERWWGAVGAVLCGVEARLMVRYPAIGWNPYAIAAGLAGCALAALDVMTTT